MSQFSNSQSSNSSHTGLLMSASHLDSRISLSLARVMIDTLRELSPRMRQRVDEKIAEEVRALREEADVHFDVLCDAAATVIEHSFEDLPVMAPRPHTAQFAQVPGQSPAPRRESVSEGMA